MENQLNSIQTIINYNTCAYTPLPDGDEFESRQLSQYNIVKLSVKNVVQQVLAQKESCIRLKNLKFSFDETTAQHEHVAYQDKDQVANIIFNLVDYVANKVTDNTEITIYIKSIRKTGIFAVKLKIPNLMLPEDEFVRTVRSLNEINELLKLNNDFFNVFLVEHLPQINQ